MSGEIKGGKSPKFLKYSETQQKILKLMKSEFKLEKTQLAPQLKWISIIKDKDPNKSHVEAYEKLEYVFNYIKTNPQKAKSEFLAFAKTYKPKPRKSKKSSKKSK
jgi:hypothetical protein